MLVAMSIVFMLVATVIPIDTLLKQERKKLHDRRIIAMELHDILQHIIWTEAKEPFSDNIQTVKINHITVHIQFKIENEWVRGCATWENAREKQEELCLYGA